MEGARGARLGGALEERVGRTVSWIARAPGPWLVALTIPLFAGALIVEQRMRAEIRGQALGHLAALAELKVDRVSAWRAERLADASALSVPPLDPAGLEALLRGAPPPAIAEWYRTVRAMHGYADVFVVSSSGLPIFSAAGDERAIEEPTADAARRALAEGGPVLSDLHRARDGRPCVDAAVPIPGTKGRAALVARTDAAALSRLLQEWPAANPSIETVLLRRDGDAVLFLNDLKHEPGAALAKRFPITLTDRVAVQAAVGTTAVSDGLDYRGVRVLAEIRPVPGSAWRLVAKVDRDELFATERHLAWAVACSVAAFLALVAIVARTWWRGELQARAAAESAVRAEALRSRAEVLENVDDGVVSVDSLNRITTWNPGAERIYGYSEAEALGRTIPDLLRTEYEKGRDRAWLLAELARSNRVELTVRQRRKDGSPVDVDSAIAARRDASGALLGYIGVNRDATDRRRVEAELKRAGERIAAADRLASVGTLAAGVAHEINNPLAYVIANLASLGEMGQALPAEAQEALADAREGAERVRRIVAELRTFARPEDASSAPLDVRSVLDTAVNLARHEIRHRARVVKAYEEVPPVDANEPRLAQALLNLVVNAAQAIPEGHAEANEIRLAVRLDGGRVRVDVTDTGAGIAPEHLGRVFDPFFTTKPVGSGTGLGLSICHGIVAALGGEIRVESAPDRGSTFSVLLPAASAAPEQDAPVAADAEPEGRRGRVLVVDDEAPLVASLRRVLARSHDVLSVSSGRDALELLARDGRFDVILCDLMMPEVTGMDVCEQLEQRAPGTARKMVFMTGGAFTPRARAFLDDPSRRRIEKPFDPQAVRALVREIVGS